MILFSVVSGVGIVLVLVNIVVTFPGVIREVLDEAEGDRR